MTPTVGSLLWYWLSSIVLAVLLYFPVHKMIWVSRVRRTERKLERVTTEAEREELRRRTRIVAAVIVVTFSFLFNRAVFPA